jgi:VWFA-related protein
MQTTFRPGIAATSALTVLIVVGVAPQAAQRESSNGLDLVTLDFRALGEGGQPVPDLKPADLSLKIDGKSREIRALRFIRTADPEPADASAGEDAPLPMPPFGSNHVSDAGRAILLIIENESLRPDTTRAALDAAGRFVQMLTPSDRVALITMPRGGVLVDLTTNHTRVIEYIDKISGQGSSSTTATDHACRTRDTLNALTGLYEGLAALPGPKTVVFVSAGLLRPTRDAPLLGPPGRCELQSKAFDDVGFAADAARVQFYAIRPEDLIVDSALTAVVDPTASRFRNTDEEIAGLESLAGVSGGVFMRLLRNDDTPFQRVVRETSGHYMLSFEPEPGERNGKNHRVELRSPRPDLNLHVRDRLLIPKAAGKSALTPQAMVRDRKVYTDLPLRAAGYASANPGDAKVKIIALLEPMDRSVQLTSAVFGLFDPKGRLVAQWTANERELGGTPVMSAGLAAAGDYQLRAAAVDANGRRGAAEYPLAAQLTPAGTMQLSAMVLGTSRNASFQPRMQFDAEPTAMGFFEIYGRPGGDLSVALELAPSEDGRALVRVPASVNVGQDPERRTVSGVVPIGSLEPGDYVVRGIVSVDGRPAGRVLRTLRKIVR